MTSTLAPPEPSPIGCEPFLAQFAHYRDREEFTQNHDDGCHGKDVCGSRPPASSRPSVSRSHCLQRRLRAYGSKFAIPAGPGWRSALNGQGHDHCCGSPADMKMDSRSITARFSAAKHHSDGLRVSESGPGQIFNWQYRTRVNGEGMSIFPRVVAGAVIRLGRSR